MGRLIPVAKNCALIILSLIIALLLIEGSAKLLLSNRIQMFQTEYIEQKNELWSFDGARKNAHRSDRVGELSRVLLAWPHKDMTFQNDMTPEDFDLHFEEAISGHSEQGHSFYVEPDTIRPDMNDDFRLVGVKSGKLKYLAHYTTDSFGRRIGYKMKSKAPNLIFLGCSFTFGQGVNDEENFVYLTGLKTQTNSFNLGQPGSSPSDTYQILKTRKSAFLGTFPDEKTAVIYTLIPEHIIRVVGTISHFRTYPDGYLLDPYITLEEGKLKIHENFAADNSGAKALFYHLAKWNFTHAFNIEYPEINDQHFKLISTILQEIEKEIRVLHPKVTDFYVAFYPVGNARKVFLQLRDYIKEEGKLKILDYSQANLAGILRHSSLLKYDGHPSPLAHDLFSEFLTHDLNRTKNPDLFSDH